MIAEASFSTAECFSSDPFNIRETKSTGREFCNRVAPNANSDALVPTSNGSDSSIEHTTVFNLEFQRIKGGQAFIIRRKSSVVGKRFNFLGKFFLSIYYSTKIISQDAFDFFHLLVGKVLEEAFNLSGSGFIKPSLTTFSKMLSVRVENTHFCSLYTRFFCFAAFRNCLRFSS